MDQNISTLPDSETSHCTVKAVIRLLLDKKTQNWADHVVLDVRIREPLLFCIQDTDPPDL